MSFVTPNSPSFCCHFGVNGIMRSDVGITVLMSMLIDGTYVDLSFHLSHNLLHYNCPHFQPVISLATD